MAVHDTAATDAGSGGSQRAVSILNARMDRLPRWALPASVPVVFAFSWFLIGYDITVFAATITKLTGRFNTTLSSVSHAVTINLIAYMVGAYMLGTVADRFGRRTAVTISIVILSVGAILSGLAWNLLSFDVFRCLTGLGMGAQIALVATFITELSPPQLRGRVLSGSTIGEGLGLAAPLLLALLKLGVGWRIMYWIGGSAALLLIPFCNDRWIPESPRWLVLHGEYDRADRIVSDMERRVESQGVVLDSVRDVPAEGALEPFATWALFRRPDLLVKTLLVFVFWFVWYVWIYAFLVYEPTLVTKLGLPLPTVDWYSGVSFLAFPLGAVVALRYADRVPRIVGIALSCLVAICGAVVLALAQDLAMVIVGAALIGFGNNAGVGLAYAYTSELFPTRARASAMSIGDGVGHLGGALQVYMTLPILTALGARWAFGFIGVCLAVNLTLVVVTRRRTAGQSLTEIAS